MSGISFLPFSILLGVLGILCVGFTVYWSHHWLGGFAWDGTDHMFNWHPVLMVTGMLVLYGIAALVYRAPLSWEGPKLPWKLLHASLTLTAFILVVLGLVAVFGYHNGQGIPNMYSLHSWIGLSAVLLFSCQWLMGFSSFLLPWAPLWLRALYKPIHVFFGSAILSLVVAACISGIIEKLFFRLSKSPTPYSSLPTEAWFGNVLGMLILVFALLVLWALARPAWKRPDVSSEDNQEPLLRGTR
ncbi:lysosomal membrane ascorbate-dependent ferrireductase CYB561A3 isoform X2 [Sceloporus undulatus]|nr:lysosomal membrane ascorbate-dependent ferrireductase CYB561A3 isoform X2 [Sceloporus undulatus]XP_042330842.1 lysosomal membrane ascorbate-dependent ferrireductase CYB561A3 isoform X2 [Sceloporus undulatus]XP_042330852.1 lysosomal membrane ascorbate-dependent ferrireductase CYB561A3 isoform X2 [Sceloporus undulatus]